MLWYKGWRETQVKVWLSFGTVAVYSAGFHSTYRGGPQGEATAVAAWGITAAILAAVVYTWLAGAGIATQPSFQMTKGLYGSTQFTLSLPVSRLRLLAVRAAIGWLEMAAVLGTYCFGSWLALPPLRNLATPSQMVEYGIALMVCASSLYFVSVLLATLLEEQWRMVGTMIATGAVALLTMLVRIPASVDLVRAIAGAGSPLIAHTMPWAPMAFSLGLTVVLFFAALKVAQAREY